MRRTASRADGAPGGGEQAAATVATGIELDGREAQLAQPPLHVGQPLVEPGDPARLHLNARALTVVAQAQIPRDAQLTQVRLALLHLGEPPWRDRDPVRHAAREARRRGRVPDGEPQRARSRAHVRLGKAHFGERGVDTRSYASGVPRPVLPQVVRVGAVAHDGQAPGVRLWNQPAPQFRLTEKAAVGGIGEVARVVELVRVELDEGDIEALGHGPGRSPLGGGIGRAPAHGSQHPRSSQLLTEHDRQQGGIDPARIPNQGGGNAAGEGAKGGEGAGHGGILMTYTVSIKGHFWGMNRIDRSCETDYSYHTLLSSSYCLRLVG